MRKRQLSGRTPRRGIGGIALLFVLTACSQGADADSASGLTDEAGDVADIQDGTSDVDGASPQDSALDDVDYDDDAGAGLSAYEYPDDPAPAAESVRTLCNLDRQYIQSLRTENADGEPMIDEELRLAVLSMSDNLILWDSMRSHYPEYEEVIADAWLIRNEWDEALLAQENGNESAARQAMRDAEEIIADLPLEALDDDIGCPT